jgi:hypothetical protein
MRKRYQRVREVPSPEELIIRDLELIAEGVIGAWIYLCDDLRLKEGQTHYHTYPHCDIKDWPGWQAADETRRGLIMSAARNFLLQFSDGYERFESGSNYAMPGCVAIWLLREELQTNQQLRESVRTKWIHGIVRSNNKSDEQSQEMASLAYELNSSEAIDALRRDTEEDFIQHGHIFAWRRFARCWDERLSAVLMEFVLSHRIKKEALLSSLSALSELDNAAFKNWLRVILPRSHRFSEDSRVMVLAIAHALAAAETWEQVWIAFNEDKNLGKRIILTLAGEPELEDRKKALKLGARQLGELAEFLYESFPPDQAIERKGGFVTARQGVADYRRKVMDTLTSATEWEAGNSLVALAKRFPELSIEFMWRYRDHLKTRRRTFWQPPSAGELSELIARSEARLVNSDRDLLEVILESLQRFEHYYTKQELPAFERLWRWTKDGNRRTGFEPKDEEDFSDELARWLGDDLARKGVIVGREVQIERKMRTDLLVKAIVHEAERVSCECFTVVVEVKGCWNRGVREDTEKQLVEKYLLPHQWTCGVYVVGWFVCDFWERASNNLSSLNIEDARQEVRQLAKESADKHPNLTIAGLLLDCCYR